MLCKETKNANKIKLLEYASVIIICFSILYGYAIYY